MLSRNQIEDQEAFERKQVSDGLDKIPFKTKKLAEKTYAYATFYISACHSKSHVN